jgi:membrane-associated phospholipid phosphatase
VTGTVDVAAPGGRKKRRRPSGEPPPLPHDLSRSGRFWRSLGFVVLGVWFFVVITPLGNLFDLADHAILHWIVDLRTPWATRLFKQLQELTADEVVWVVRWVALLGALLSRRFRHTIVFIGVILFTTWVGAVMTAGIGRPRPLDIEILGYWSGFSHPSRPLIDIAVALLGVTYLLIPRGQWRQAAKWAIGIYLAVATVDRLYLGVEHPSDSVFGIIIGVTASLLAYRVFVPNDVFPVRYGRGKAAHLDVTGTRGEAIRRALADQLGLDVASLAPFGLEGSAGSTPLKITLGDGTVLFGKLYAATHLRADRWYKLGRTLLYGRLEDESTFSTVRRLVQYEDYVLRVMQDAGLPTARPYGFAEITPEREYVIVTEFFAGADEIGDAEVDDTVIVSALRLVRSLWDAGLAHRDVKPANLLVRDGKVLMIDVAFARVRPSPWREAVDLANMMLVLALRSDPDRVYELALDLFTPDEISEAFAATRGLTLTSQLKSQMKADGRDLIGRFRELAPPRAPIRIQRWTLRRVGLTLGVLLAFLFTLSAVLALFSGAHLL